MQGAERAGRTGLNSFATVLLLEDQRAVVASLRRCLTGEGYRFLLAADVERARDHLESEIIDAILTDVVLPGVGGLAFLREVRERWPGVARALITGWPEALRREELAAAQPFAVFAKPWDVQELRTALRSVCAMPQSGLHPPGPKPMPRSSH